MPRMKKIVEQVEKDLQEKRAAPKVIDPNNLLSTGSTLLNLALSDNPKGGLVKGEYTFFVGDSNSGKSFFTTSILAEATLNPHFKDYRLILDDSEGGNKINVEKMFGKNLAERMEPPLKDKKGNPCYSRTVEDFYYRINDAIDKKQPFIWVEDSMDALIPTDTVKHFESNKAAYDKGKQAAGSYGTEKAKINSKYLPKVVSDLKDSGSILIIISQTRDNIGFGSQFNPKTRAGGNALSFYACCELWTSVRQKLHKSVKGVPLETGILSKVKVARSRLNGKQRSVELPIYWSAGIDEIGSMVNFLVDWKHWKKQGKNGDEIEEEGDNKKKKGGGLIAAPEWEVTLPSEKLVAYIEEKGIEMELRSIVTQVWNEIERECVVPRKNRYI